jgi:hypothetical protein
VPKPCYFYNIGDQILSETKRASHFWNIPKTWEMVFLEVVINLPTDKGKKGNVSHKEYDFCCTFA